MFQNPFITFNCFWLIFVAFCPHGKIKKTEMLNSSWLLPKSLVSCQSLKSWRVAQIVLVDMLMNVSDEFIKCKENFYDSSDAILLLSWTWTYWIVLWVHPKTSTSTFSETTKCLWLCQFQADFEWHWAWGDWKPALWTQFNWRSRSSICYDVSFYSDLSVYTCVHGSMTVNLYFTLKLHSCDSRLTITIVLLKLAIFFWKRLNTTCLGPRSNHPCVLRG